MIVLKVVVAADSFKGSASSSEVCNSVTKGIKRVFPDSVVVEKQIADGGENTALILTKELEGDMTDVSVHGPLGVSFEKITSKYGIIPISKTAILDMASAAGLTLIPSEKRNPLNTTTLGVGEIILDAMNRGCRNFIVGIGGSSTNDCGIGMLTALGFAFRNADGEKLDGFGSDLKDVKSIDFSGVSPKLTECKFTVMCDVTNPLYGDMGCSRVYAPQKGATPDIVETMDSWIKNYSELVKTYIPDADPNYEGSGAAGGLGYAFKNFLNAELKSGISVMMEAIGLEEEIKTCDYVITGEGAIDSQTLSGKLPVGVAAISKKYGKPVIAICGALLGDPNELNKKGIDAIFPIHHEVLSLEEAMNPQKTKEDITITIEQIMNVIRINGGL